MRYCFEPHSRKAFQESIVNTTADCARNLGVKLDKHLTLPIEFVQILLGDMLHRSISPIEFVRILFIYFFLSSP